MKRKTVAFEEFVKFRGGLKIHRSLSWRNYVEVGVSKIAKEDASDVIRSKISLAEEQ